MAHVREKPPLRVKVDIQTPGGKHYRWAEDEPSPENVPSGLRWSDTMPGGFETMDCVLPRKPGIDYADLEQLSTIRVLGASGDVAGEFRLERAPRTSGDQVSVSPGAVGWQAHLEDDKSVREIYVDRDLSHWAESASVQRQANIATTFPIMGGASVVPDDTGNPAVEMQMDRFVNTAGVKQIMETWYRTPGIALGKVFFDYTSSDLGAGGGVLSGSWVAEAFLCDDDTQPVGSDTTGNLGGAVVTYLDATTDTRQFAKFDFYFNAAGTADGLWKIRLRRAAAFGTHGIVGVGADPPGLYGSDVVRHAVAKWCPLLSVTTESVQPSSFVIPHLVFLEPTTVGEVVRQTTRFGLQDWGVWDNKTFWWHERGTFSKRWRSRVSPAQLDETGPQVDRLWESIIVSYQDVDGSTRTVGPPGSGANTEDAVLKDSDPENPANLLGIIRRDVLQMGVSTAAGATEVGRRFLEQAQLLDRSGRARLVGHVEDDRGVLHPYWSPRAGDYIQFLDAADSSYRRIVKTDKDHSARTCGLDLDAPPEGLQALLERLGVVLVPLGVG